MDEIRGVSLAVLKDGRSLTIEHDGYLGELSSGGLEIRASVRAGLPFYGVRKWSRHTYELQKDHAPLMGITDGTKVYCARMPIEANGDTGESFVAPPNNLLCLTELVLDTGKVTSQVRVWKVAAVSQGGHFFLTTQLGYDTVGVRDGDGIVFRRFQAHPTLNDVLVALRPDESGCVRFPQWEPNPDNAERPRKKRIGEDRFSGVLPVPAQFVPRSDSPEQPLSLVQNQGMVLRFFNDSGIGIVQTLHGEARVHWTDCPRRERRAFLLPKERIRFGRIGTPRRQIRDRYSLKELGLVPRETGFKYQVYGPIEVLAV